MARGLVCPDRSRANAGCVMGVAGMWSAPLLLAALVVARPAAAAATDPLAPGAVLDATTAGAAADLLPPEILAHYQTGNYRNRLGAWPARPHWEPAFSDASASNASRLDVDERGSIVEKPQGTLVRGLYGLPFRIDPADPRAGVKVVWNAYYAYWRTGTSRDVLALDWVGKRGLERQAVLESHALFWEGAPRARIPKDNPLDLAAQQRAVVSSPADLNGTASLVWRFREADRRDQAWTYVPALRRVRQVSPANRSDGFLGSDLSQDDGAFFDGKPEDFSWKLLGERTALVLADPASLEGRVERRGRPDGGIEETWPEGQTVLGYQDAGWKGLPWAPIGPVRVQRKLWVIEAVPKDPYYQYGRIEIGIDQETFQGVRSRKFDANGALLRSLEFLTYASQAIEAGGEQLIQPASSMGCIVAENTRAGRATVVGSSPPGKSVHERRVLFDPALFSLERLGPTGK